jgi:hypothetical protein
MAFGAYTGRSGGIGQRPYGLSAMFLGLSQGLSEFAKMSAGEDARKATQQHDDARLAAEQAFQQNMARFSQEHQDKREDTRQAHEDARTKQQTDTQAAWHAADVTERGQFHADEETHRKAQEALQARGLEINAESKASLEEQRKQHAEEYKQQVEASKAAMARGDAATALKMADDMMATPRMNYAKALEEYKAATKNGIDPDSQEQKDALNNLNNAKSDVATAEKAIAPIREKALKAVGYGSDSATQTPGSEASAKDLMKQANDKLKAGADPDQTLAWLKDQMSKQGMQPSGGASDPLSTLSPDQQAAAKSVMSARGLSPQQAADWAKSAPPEALQKAQSLAPPATSATQPTDGSFIPPDSTQAAAPAVAQAPATPDQTAAPQPPSVAEATPPPGPMTANANEAQGLPAQTGTTADDKSAQFQQIAQQLGQSPEGQGVQATLDRLAEAKDGPVADKMRRTAQIQLEQNFGVDSDTSSGFIDYSLDQNAQQSEIA